ncbi:MAG: hypothetical protein ACLVI9_00280 [Anaerostipes hadrus]
MSRERYRKEQENLLQEICERLQNELELQMEKIRQNEADIALLRKKKQNFRNFKI